MLANQKNIEQNRIVIAISQQIFCQCFFVLPRQSCLHKLKLLNSELILYCSFLIEHTVQNLKIQFAEILYQHYRKSGYSCQQNRTDQNFQRQYKPWRKSEASCVHQ